MLVKPPGEFEAFAGLRRFGFDLVAEFASGLADSSPLVPSDYAIQVGDELLVTIWGTVDADLRLVVDRAGRVAIPRVGPVQVQGVRNDALQEVLSNRVGQVFKNFQLSASLGQLRGVRIYVTGFAERAGSYVVPPLSTVMSAVLRAGGPAAAGSFRQIELRRKGRVEAVFDLYDLLLRGDRNADRVVQPDDVIHVAVVGAQVGLSGSVHRPAVFELKPGESIKDVIAMAGGLSAVADRERVLLERIDERVARRVAEVPLPAGENTPLSNGDMLRVVSAVEATLSIQPQNRRVKVEGEVARPGTYVLPAGQTIADAIKAAGGLMSSAYVFGTEFQRESVRTQQQQNYERALRDLETDLARSTATRRISNQDEASSQPQLAASNARIIDQLRSLRPNGRLVLELLPESRDLPPLLLEDGDRIYIPPVSNSVGIFGSVFNSGSYLYTPGRTLGEFLRLAGGPTKGADESSVFVVRANGQVVSSRQNRSLLSSGNRIGEVGTQPGDTIFVPEELDKTTFVQSFKDWTQILSQFGLGVAGIRVLTR